MNNADFLSDAVALDLGKSGVKIAETLEIEVGDEWWRLINAAAVTDARVYDARRKPSSLVDAGTIDLSSLVYGKKIGKANASSMPKNGPFIFKFANGNIVLLYTFMSGTYLTLTGHNITKDTTWTVGPIATYHSTPWAVFFDGARDRIGYSYASVSPRIYCRTLDEDGASTTLYTSGGYYYESPSADYYGTFSLPEEPTKSYSIFWTSGTVPRIKTYTHAIGDDFGNKALGLTLNSNAVALSSIPSTAVYTAGIHFFYLRSAESVGLAFLDGLDNRVKYILESESWGTVRILPDMAAGSQELIGFGTIMLPVDGEFFYASFNKTVTGNLARPTGYSFPENFVVNGVYKTGEKNFRLFGSVGSTLYSYTLDPDTMALDYHGIASSSWGGGGEKPVLIAASGDLEFLKFGGVSDPLLAMYNSLTHTIVWTWKGWTNSAYFPTTYIKASSSSLWRVAAFWAASDRIFLIGLRSDTDMVRAEMHSFTYSQVFNSSSMDALLSSSTRSLQQVGWAATGMSQYAPRTHVTGNPEEGCLYVGETQTHYIFYYCESPSTYYNRSYHLRLQRDTLLFEVGAYFDNVNKDSTIPALGVQNMANRIEPDRNLNSELAINDNWFRHFSARDIRFVSAVNNGSLVKGELNAENLTWGSGWRTYHVATGQYGQGCIYSGMGTSLRIVGAFYDGANEGAQSKTINLPFTYRTMTIDEWTGVTIVLGDVVSGDIPFLKLKGGQGNLDNNYCVKVSDSSVYTADLGHLNAGGEYMCIPRGTLLFYSSMTGCHYLRNTGALWDEGMGGEVSGGDSVVIYDYLDQQYLPYPFAREGIRAELSNISKTTKITLPETQDNLIRGMLAAGTDFRGSRCILRRVFPDHLDEVGSDIVLLDGYIQDWSYVPGKKGIAFSVSKTLIDVGAQFPKRLMNMGCSHVFKGSRCRYLGEEGRCLKTRAFCTSLGNLNQFGGFPWVAARQRRVMWK